MPRAFERICDGIEGHDQCDDDETGSYAARDGTRKMAKSVRHNEPTVDVVVGAKRDHARRLVFHAKAHFEVCPAGWDVGRYHGRGGGKRGLDW